MVSGNTESLGQERQAVNVGFRTTSAGPRGADGRRVPEEEQIGRRSSVGWCSRSHAVGLQLDPRCRTGRAPGLIADRSPSRLRMGIANCAPVCTSNQWNRGVAATRKDCADGRRAADPLVWALPLLPAGPHCGENATRLAPLACPCRCEGGPQDRKPAYHPMTDEKAGAIAERIVEAKRAVWRAGSTQGISGRHLRLRRLASGQSRTAGGC